MAEKNKSGAGKFFLGALLGSIAGAVAGKFIKIEPDDGEELDEIEDEIEDDDGKCDKCKCVDCKCDKKSDTEEKPVAKKKSNKK